MANLIEFVLAICMIAVMVTCTAWLVANVWP